MLLRQTTPVVLNASNDFTTILEIPPGIRVDYVNLDSRFSYIRIFAQVFPAVVECKFDGKRWLFNSLQVGRQKISNNNDSPYPFRINLLYNNRRLQIQLTFPGAFNFKPSQITLEKHPALHVPRPDQNLPPDHELRVGG